MLGCQPRFELLPACRAGSERQPDLPGKPSGHPAAHAEAGRLRPAGGLSPLTDVQMLFEKLIMFCLKLKASALQDNQLCTLKGSLARFKFLETLDLSGNKLCNLAKLLETLGKFQFLQMLNLVVRLPTAHAPHYSCVHHSSR